MHSDKGECFHLRPAGRNSRILTFSLCAFMLSALLNSVFGDVIVINPPPNPTLYTVQVTASPADGGTVGGGGSFYSSTSVKVSAVPNAGYRFDHWSENDAAVSSSAGYSFTISSNRSLVANFAVREFVMATNAGWSSQFVSPAAVDGVVYATTSRAKEVYIGGNFSTASGSNVQNIAKWNGQQWLDVGGGLNGPVHAMAWSGRDLIVGGSFTQAGTTPATNIARWNGISWQAIGSGLDGSSNSIVGASAIRALATNGRHIYAAGAFDHAGELTVANIAHWNGTEWAALGDGIADANGSVTNAVVYSLALRGSQVYAGGCFQRAGTNSAMNVAVWKGADWKPLQGGVKNFSFFYPSATRSSCVYSLLFIGGRLYVGGDFNEAIGLSETPSLVPVVASAVISSPGLTLTDSGAVSVNNLAVWTGNEWLSSDSFNKPIHQLSGFGSRLIACGEFTQVNGVAMAGIASGSKDSIRRTDRPHWLPVGSGISGPVLTSTILDRDLYAAGAFEKVGDRLTGSVALWRGTNWLALGTGSGNGLIGNADGAVVAANQYGASVFGAFSCAGSLPINSAASWDGQQWSAMGNGLTNYNLPLNAAAMDNDVLLSGSMQIPGLQIADIWSSFKGLARWDGTQWYAFGTAWGESRTKQILAADEYRLYTLFLKNNFFSTAIDAIEEWNGADWISIPLLPVGNGYNAAAADVDLLYIAQGSQISKWDGSSWSNIPAAFQGRYVQGTSGVFGIPTNPTYVAPTITSMIVFNGELYVAGDFTGVNGLAITNLARWNGTTWSSAGDAFDTSSAKISSMAKSSNRLYIAGDFQNVGGVAAQNIARWDGAQWAALDSGISNDFGVVSSVSLAAYGNQLYVLGNFSRAGGLRAQKFAVWTEPLP
jgi:trimeric autotransporter adhesin